MPVLFNVSSMNLHFCENKISTVLQRVSNSPSKIRGGAR